MRSNGHNPDSSEGPFRGKSGELVRVPGCTTLYQWSSLSIPAPDYLLGQFLSTSSRSLFVGPSGIGKTNVLMAVAMAMSQGLDFLHWRAGRAARVLYIDGEMGVSLAKRRVLDACRRIGRIDHPDNFHFVCLNQLAERPPPLNSEAGQQYMNAVIEDCRSEFVYLDNIQSLLSGPMVDEEPWLKTLPWAYSLTRRRIGQLWIHHTGWDRSHGYGTATREWQMETVVLAEGEPDADHVEFKLKFQKARERTPENRADFEPKIITLDRDEWSVIAVEDPRRKGSRAAKEPKGKPPSPMGAKYHDALVNALAKAGEPRADSGGLPSVTDEEWQAEIRRAGLFKDGEDAKAQHTNRARLSKYRTELIAANWAIYNGGLVWSVRGVE